MARFWSGALLVTAVVCVGGAVGLMNAAAASPTSALATTSISEATPSPGVGHAPGAPTPRKPGTETLSQTVRLDVRGGDLTIEPGFLVVDLERHGDVLRGEIPQVTIVDARGTLAGWRAGVRMTEVVGFDEDGRAQRVPPGKVRLVPSTVSAVAGDDADVRPGLPVRGRGLGVLASARRGGGGGTFVAAGTVELTGSSALGAASVTIVLSIR